MSSVIIEFLKLRRSASWGVVLVLPTVSVLCACVLVRPTDWQLLWVRSIGFYGMVLLPVSLGVLASFVWRVEHQGSNGLALMSGPVPTWRTVAAKAAAAWLLAAVMQFVLMLAATTVGALVLGLPGILPSRYLVAGLLIAVACAPVCALQSGLSAFTRSFAVPVAIGLALTGVGTTALLVHIPAAWLLPHALVTRTTQIGATSDGAALVFAAQDLNWTSAAVTVGISAALSAVVVLVTSTVLDRADFRT
ncbi:ABC transporter [Actinomyces naeslundii]|uniref:ABC transporter permease n=1 Tax=Actinomyces naeslundii TaxID=1655 RepID=UPI00094D263B|nr:ABC transporter permease [Actinomyces naeslundii]OLO90624.1 ABC transporter [Actinomyces naeslundii]